VRLAEPAADAGPETRVARGRGSKITSSVDIVHRGV